MSVYETRRQRLAAEAERAGLVGVLVTSPFSVQYLTGYRCNPHERFLGLFLGGGAARLVLPAMDAVKAKRYLPGAAESALRGTGVPPVNAQSGCLGYTDSEGPEGAAAAALAGIAGGALGVEKDVFTLARAEMLQAIRPGVSFEDVTPLVRSLRAIKDAEEIRRMREAARMVDDVVAHGISQIRRGMTEAQLRAILEARARELGSPRMAFDTMVLSGAKSAEAHGVTGSDPILDKEFLLLDLGVEFEGYFSDITRTFLVGNVSDKHREVYRTVLRGQEAAIAATRAGVAIGTIDRAARSIIEEAGYGPQFFHRLGHGLGLDVHEYPSVMSENTDILRAGMAFTIEPGIYLPGFGGVRIEDDVVATENGCDVLTKFPKGEKECTVELG